MLNSDKLEFERGAAAKTEGEDRNNGKENRHHGRHGTTSPPESPAVSVLWEILSKDTTVGLRWWRRATPRQPKGDPDVKTHRHATHHPVRSLTTRRSRR